MLDDLYALVHDMDEFRGRALALAEKLQDHKATGSSAYGYEALSGHVSQLGKVLRNYLNNITKEVEEIPGGIDAMYAYKPADRQNTEAEELRVKLRAALQHLDEAHKQIDDLKARPPAAVTLPISVPDELRDLVRDGETDQQALTRFHREYADFMSRLIDNRLPTLTDTDREKLTRLEQHIYKSKEWVQGI